MIHKESMTKRCLIKEYFTDPFVCFGLALLITGILSNFVSIVSDFEGYLFMKFFYIAYFYGTSFLYVMLMIEPLKAFKKYETPKKIRLGLPYAIIIIFILSLSAIPILLEPYMFYSEKFNAIKNPKVVLEMYAYAYFVGLMGAPILGIFVKRLIIKQLLKDKIEVPKVNYGMIFSISWMFFISLLIIFVSFDTFHICFAKGICP